MRTARSLRMVWYVLGATLLFLTGVFGFAAVARGADAARAGEAARAFLTAFDSSDRAALETTLTRAGRAKLSELSEWEGTTREASSGEERHHSLASVTLGQPVIEDDRATVAVTDAAGTGEESDEPRVSTVLLRREEGKWRVYAVVLHLPQGLSPVTLNFEHPEDFINEMARVTGEATGRALGAFAKGIAEAAKAFQKGFEQGMRTAPTP